MSGRVYPSVYPGCKRYDGIGLYVACGLYDVFPEIFYRPGDFAVIDFHPSLYVEAVSLECHVALCRNRDIGEVSIEMFYADFPYRIFRKGQPCVHCHRHFHPAVGAHREVGCRQRLGFYPVVFAPDDEIVQSERESVSRETSGHEKRIHPQSEAALLDVFRHDPAEKNHAFQIQGEIYGVLNAVEHYFRVVRKPYPADDHVGKSGTFSRVGGFFRTAGKFEYVPCGGAVVVGSGVYPRFGKNYARNIDLSGNQAGQVQ